MTIPDDISKSVSAVVGGFKGSPTCLAAVVLATIMAALTYFALQNSEIRQANEKMEIIRRCFPAVPSALPDDMKAAPILPKLTLGELKYLKP
jgi:hypothetical protein